LLGMSSGVLAVEAAAMVRQASGAVLNETPVTKPICTLQPRTLEE
jgi:hypothetical protein